MRIKEISSVIKRAKKNDIRAQKELYNMYINKMYNTAYRILNDYDDTNDIVQDSFVSAFQKLKQLDDPNSFEPWLKRVVINNCLKFLKNKLIFLDIDHVDIIEETDSDWYKDFPIEQIRNEINKLPNGCREILLLYIYENYKHKEIAELLNISASTSKSQYQRALSLLRKNLKKMENETV